MPFRHETQDLCPFDQQSFHQETCLLRFHFHDLHSDVIAVVDLYTLYPTSLRPAFMDRIHEFQITNFQDQFFIAPPAWFKAYVWMEAIYHVPLSLWAIGAILRGEHQSKSGWPELGAKSAADDPKLPIHLLIFAMQAGVTTLTCIADYMSWTVISSAQKAKLHQLYVPYLALGTSIGSSDKRVLRCDLNLRESRADVQQLS